MDDIARVAERSRSRASRDMMPHETCATGKTGATNACWELLMSEALGMTGKYTSAPLKANFS
jgi:hypothetical protein